MSFLPPVARRVSHPTTRHGDTRPDDYFWLRDKPDPEVQAYLEAENAYAESVLAPLRPFRDKLYAEMLGRIRQTDLSVPYRKGGYWYYSRTEEGKQYPILCRKAGTLDAPEQITLDLNQLAEPHPFFALGAYTVSNDGNLLAYSSDVTGFREYTLVVKDLRTGAVTEPVALRTGSVTFAADNETLFYTVEDSAKRQYRLYRHRLGESDHHLVYEETDERFRVGVWRTRSGAFLILDSSSHTQSELRFLGAAEPGGSWRIVAARETDHEYDIDHHGENFYIRTNLGGRNFRLVAAPATDPSPVNWTEVLPHRDTVMLEGVAFFANHWVAFEREDALPHLRVTSLATGAFHRIAFPEPVYDLTPDANPEFDTRVYRYRYQSFITPASVFEYDLDSRAAVLLKQTEVLGGFDPSLYVSERLWATAEDGTRVPISLVRRKDAALPGPLLLYGYGSYGYSIPASFSSNRLSLVDRGVAYAVAHIRGGGELGKPWHDQGRMFHKRNTFTDFIACAEHLVAQGYTEPAKLVIEGGSAGGLLVAAVTNLRPDLFHAVVAQVPFVDVLNTMLDESLPLTIGEFEEWGNPKLADQYAYIRSYCPYTNLAAVSYPAILIKTSFNDSQVFYHEPAKYVARLRCLTTGDKPVLLVTNMAAGHGGASGRYDRLREVALDYAFILWQVDRAD